ncbi:MAG: MMPL family transporter [Deltaproteobacteria bacterium]|nr:MMPL family transporter [Deltaproteobacteria bacterium]
MRRFFLWVTDHPWTVIGTCFAVTAVFAYGLTGLKPETDVSAMLPDGHATVEHAREIEEIFEIDPAVVIAVVNDRDGGIYNAHTLKLIRDIADGLADVRGVDPQQIVSIYSASHIQADEGGFAVLPLSEGVPETSEEIVALRDRVRGDTLYHGSLVSDDGRGTLIYAAITPVADKAGVYFSILDLIDRLDAQGEKFYVTGDPVVHGVIGIHVEKDMSRMMPMVAGVIVLMLGLIFRNLRGVVLPLGVVLLSVIWAMGLMAFCGIPLYPMTTIVPIVIMAIGVADGIHIITRYMEGAKRHPEDASRAIVVRTMMEMWPPVVMTSLTTAVGFLSLLTSDMKPIFHTGVFTAFGVLAAMFFSLMLLPASLSLMHVPAVRTSGRWWTGADHLFETIGRGVFRHARWVAAACAGVVLLSIAGTAAVDVDSDPMANFNQSDPIPISTKLINKMFRGAVTVHLTLRSDEENRFLDPAVLEAVDRFAEAARKLPRVGFVTSVVDMLKMMHAAMTGAAPGDDTVPPTRNLVGTYFMLYTGENLDEFINYGRNFRNITVRIMSTSTKELAEVIARLGDIARAEFSGFDGVNAETGGLGVVLVDMINILVYGQIWSILLSILGVFVITSIMFRSLVAGVFNIVPISVATLINFGVMGLMGIPLEPATAITSCIGIGVGIDYAIHFIAKYKFTRRKQITGRRLVEITMSTAGKAIFFNAAVVIGGFLVLLASAFPPSRHMGFMISLNMFTSFAASVTILPVLLARFDPTFCHETAGIFEAAPADDTAPAPANKENA